MNTERSAVLDAIWSPQEKLKCFECLVVASKKLLSGLQRKVIVRIWDKQRRLRQDLKEGWSEELSRKPDRLVEAGLEWCDLYKDGSRHCGCFENGWSTAKAQQADGGSLQS